MNFDRALYPCAAVSAAAKAQKVSLDRRKLLEECGGEKRAAVDKLVKEITEAVEKRDSENSKTKGEKSKKSIVETIMEKVSDVICNVSCTTVRVRTTHLYQSEIKDLARFGSGILVNLTQYPTLGSQRECGRREEGNSFYRGRGVWVRRVRPGGVQRLEAEDVEGGWVDSDVIRKSVIINEGMRINKRMQYSNTTCTCITKSGSIGLDTDNYLSLITVSSGEGI